MRSSLASRPTSLLLALSLAAARPARAQRAAELRVAPGPVGGAAARPLDAPPVPPSDHPGRCMVVNGAIGAAAGAVGFWVSTKLVFWMLRSDEHPRGSTWDIERRMIITGAAVGLVTGLVHPPPGRECFPGQSRTPL